MSEFCGEKDVITPISEKDEKERKKLGFKGAQNYYVPYRNFKPYDWARWLGKGKRKRYFNHMPASEIRRYTSTKIWKEYYKFCVERNPFDKIISHYYWAGGPQKYGSLSQYLDQRDYQEIQGFDMYSYKGELLVNEVFKYENMDQVLSYLSDKLKLPIQLELPEYKAKSQHRKDRRPYQDSYAKQEKEVVERLFSREIAHWNYSF